MARERVVRRRASDEELADAAGLMLSDLVRFSISRVRPRSEEGRQARAALALMQEQLEDFHLPALVSGHPWNDAFILSPGGQFRVFCL